MTQHIATALIAILFASSLAGGAVGKPNSGSLKTQSIDVKFRPLSGFDKVGFTKRTYGALEWIGGGVLTADTKHFGGWSGLALDRDGRRMLAVSDAGAWWTASLAYKDNQVIGIKDSRIGPLRALSGKPLRRGRDRDAEAVVLTSGSLSKGRVLVGFEQNHRIGTFRIGAKGLSAPRRYIALPRIAKRMRALKGFEAVTELKGPRRGTLVAIAERKLDRRGNHRGWIWRKGRARPFTLTNIGGFDITDAAALPDGGILVLERRFRWLEGVKMRIRYIASKSLRPGATLKGEVLMSADIAQQIDNMEGLAVHKAKDGAFILTILSDDNFNRFLQRTLLLQFRWQRGSKTAHSNK